MSTYAGVTIGQRTVRFLAHLYLMRMRRYHRRKNQ